MDNTERKTNLTTDEFITRAKALYPEYDYSKVEYVKDSTPVVVICNKHGEFKVTPSLFLQRRGCLVCNSRPKGENRIEEWLKTHNISYVRQFRFDDLKGKSNLSIPYDFYIESKKCLIDFNGVPYYPTWFGNGKQNYIQSNEELKRDYAKQNGFSFIEISFYEFDSIEKILTESLL